MERPVFREGRIREGFKKEKWICLFSAAKGIFIAILIVGLKMVS